VDASWVRSNVEWVVNVAKRLLWMSNVFLTHGSLSFFSGAGWILPKFEQLLLHVQPFSILFHFLQSHKVSSRSQKEV